ncbi:uncharacterized protein Bfra_004854 [Botrytis fragariae]|uniref:Uncharacterized protein n=1 Tax=Botrytis fragariae TaxID=1964551 RepID=A0A8H6ATV1_9HELO|nr:uncharacterized protein Bfra_004854 [Botrytis fragariae]KAF5873394.1 hypothetical protein Bfra_004854 [Botrytis fragariae]
MELLKSESLGKIPSPSSTTSQLDQEGDYSLSSDNSIDSDIFLSKRYKFMCKRNIPVVNLTKSENSIYIFVEAVNSIPQPHHRANMVCYQHPDIKYRGKKHRIEGSIYDEPHRLKVTETRWIKSVLDAAREGCCLCTLVVQAIPALGKGHFRGSPFSVYLQVKDVDGIKRHLYELTLSARHLFRTMGGLSLPFITDAPEISNTLPESLQTAQSWIANFNLIETKNVTERFAALSPRLPYLDGDDRQTFSMHVESKTKFLTMMQTGGLNHMDCMITYFYRIIEFKENEWTLGNDEIVVDLDPYHYGPNKPTESAIKVKKNVSLFLMFVGTRKFKHYAEHSSFLALRYLEEDERGNAIFMRAGIAVLDELSMNVLDRVRAGTKESIVLI